MENDADLSKLRWTVDTLEDFELMKRISTAGLATIVFSWREVLTLLQEEPQWQEVNRHVSQKVIQ